MNANVMNKLRGFKPQKSGMYKIVNFLPLTAPPTDSRTFLGIAERLLLELLL
jgi:hypothetical protein